MPNTEQNSGRGKRSSAVIENGTPLSFALTLQRVRALLVQCLSGFLSNLALSFSAILAACLRLYSRCVSLILSRLDACQRLILAFTFSLLAALHRLVSSRCRSKLLCVHSLFASPWQNLHQLVRPSLDVLDFGKEEIGCGFPSKWQDLLEHTFVAPLDRGKSLSSNHLGYKESYITKWNSSTVNQVST